ncbi:tyrosine-type recombinase/integrase [Pseudomonas fulva]|uniref:tyrosine-type recombinase/integrase n=1 Tax=Pseudomonas fulva TaxID=47880 RepID=UPI0018A93A13|nr:tyrosine-type recombinase/integrase [Pseudomonas fulva]MBF8776319.1 tyrosine-type recombinase/integrase [Pseudomonas fulva]
MAGNQLHRPLDQGAMLPTGLYSPALTLQDASNLPCFYFPNGDFYFEINAFIIKAWKYGGYSTTNKGSTLRQWGMQLSELTRFMENNRINVLSITDPYFVMFINGLMVEKELDGEDRRHAETVRAIGSKCLEFLSFATNMYGYPDYVSSTGVVKGYKVEPEDKRTRPSEYRRIAWYHPCFPLSSDGGEGSPVLTDSVLALKKEARKRSPSLAARSKILISVLENLGCRRAEAARIQVSDVMTAIRSTLDNPLLRLPMVKGRNRFRFMSVPRSVLSTWVDYITDFRNSRMEELRLKAEAGDRVDHDFLFISLRSGQPLSINTITNEISDLRLASGMTKRAHPHMFRHRFITNKFKELIIEYDLQNTDVMRNSIANSDLIKRKLREWTGHKLVESLERYIHLAFSELANMPAVVNRVHETAEYKAAKSIFRDLQDDLEAGQISQAQFERTASELLGDLFARKDAGASGGVEL